MSIELRELLSLQFMYVE